MKIDRDSARWWLWQSPLLLAALALAGIAFAPTDSTDLSRWGRSGLRLHIDAATGCHYVSTLFGGPTPRLGRDGEQICTGAE